MKLFTTLNSKKIIVTHRYTIVTYSYNKKYELKFLVISYVHLRKKSNVKRFLRKISEKNLHERFLPRIFQSSPEFILLEMMPKGLFNYVKSLLIRSFSGPYFSHSDQIRRNVKYFYRIQSRIGKIRTRKNPITDTFHAVFSALSNIYDEVFWQ